MFCPNCGLLTSEELKFCKQCGANLRAVQEAMLRPEASGAIDWNKSWLAEILMSQEERDRRQGITPEIKRLNEIKDGVITTFVGLGVMIFLYFLLGAVAAMQEPAVAEILRHVWLAGLIPFLIGLAITFNGLIIGRRVVELKRQQLPDQPPRPQSIKGATTDQLAVPPAGDFSVTEQTTTRLGESPRTRE